MGFSKSSVLSRTTSAKDVERDDVEERQRINEPSTSEICGNEPLNDNGGDNVQKEAGTAAEKRLRFKVDLRLCTIAGLICSLDLLDSAIISSAAVTDMFTDLDMYGSHYSMAIWIFSVGNIVAQLPSTFALRYFGPRVWFTAMTFGFGLLTLCSAFTQTWRQMVAIRALLGVVTSGVYPCAAYLLSTWYTRREQQLRFSFLQGAQVFVVATGTIVNYGLNMLNGKLGLHGWRHLFLWQGLFACVIGIVTYWWIVDFPEHSQRSFHFLTPEESALAVRRVDRDRGDVETTPFKWKDILTYAVDVKIYGWAVMLFLLNLVTTALAFFLPIILQGGLGFSSDQTILLSAPPYYYAAIPAILSSYISDKYCIRGPVIIFNSLCLIAGFGMFGFANSSAVRYIGTFLATGAYSSNWAALNAYPSTNVVGQWKRAYMFAVITAFNRAGGVAGAYIVRQNEAPRYPTGVWISIGSHILMIAFVLVFSLYFYRANMLQKRGRRLIENTPGFRYSY